MERVSRIALTLLMVGAGVMHFRAPGAFIRVVPRLLPSPALLVLVSGAFEILLGVGLLAHRTRRWAAWGLVGLFIVVFPANLNMAVNRMGFGGRTGPAWLLWARLPMQAVLIAWAFRYTRPDGPHLDGTDGCQFPAPEPD